MRVTGKTKNKLTTRLSIKQPLYMLVKTVKKKIDAIYSHILQSEPWLPRRFNCTGGNLNKNPY